MTSNMELYGTEDVPCIPKEICEDRLKLLDRRLSELLMVHFMNQDIYTINKVIKAQAFWIKMRDGEVL